MKFKYKASWIATVEKYPYTSETTKKVVIGYDNLLKKTISYSKETLEEKFCDTFQEAKDFLINKHVKKIKELEGALEFVRQNLERAKSLTEEDIKEEK